MKDASNNSIIDLFKHEFASTAIPVFIKSLNKEVEFREITVKEQKALTKTQIENQHRPATVYRAFTGLIENTILTKNIDIGSLTEADRYNILINLYQTAFLDRPTEYKCNHCNNSFMASINTKNISENFINLNIEDRVYTVQDTTRLYIFTCGYPTINHLTDILGVFQRKYLADKTQELGQTEIALISVMESIDYTNSFIKSITIERHDKTTEPITAVFEKMSADDCLNTIALMPQHIMLDEERGIVSKILTDFITPINNVFIKQKCPHCNEEYSNQIGSVMDFLG